MCLKCEQLEEHKKQFDNMKLLLRSLIDMIDEVMDKIVCDNILIEELETPYYCIPEGYSSSD